MAEKLLTIREVSVMLGINEKEVIELSEKGIVPAYKVGGVYLRFKREQVEHYRDTFLAKDANHKPNLETSYSAGERLRDFFYFYDFYILSGALIVILLVIIIKG